MDAGAEKSTCVLNKQIKTYQNQVVFFTSFLNTGKFEGKGKKPSFILSNITKSNKRYKILKLILTDKTQKSSNVDKTLWASSSSSSSSSSSRFVYYC